MIARMVVAAALGCGLMQAQLTLAPSEPLSALHPPTAAPAKAASGETPSGTIRPSFLTLLPAGDPLYLGEEKPESASDQWRTYSPPRVDAISRNGAGLALQGFDVLSYPEGRAEAGRKEFSLEYGAITWLFSTADHLRQFARHPEQFVPEYGGFCAYSIGKGFPATADPKAFITEGSKVYLFFDQATKTVWEQDRRRLVAAADRHWPKLHR